MKRALILGGGFAGCAAADQLRLLGGWDVTLIETGNQLGAGVRTQWYGGHPYTFGPRHFLTQDERAVAYLNDIVPLRACPEHEFLTYVEADAAFYNYPIHVDDIPRMPEAGVITAELAQARERDEAGAARNLEEYWIASVGRTLYEKFVEGYSKKMWKVADNLEIDTFSWSPKGVALKSGPRAAWDSAYSGYPLEPGGYNRFFSYATQDADVRLNTRCAGYDPASMQVNYFSDIHSPQYYDVIVCTISPDIFGHYAYGELPYIGRDITRLVLPVEFALPPNVYMTYYAGREPYTRVTEYKKFTGHKDVTSTLITLEVPSANGNYYPLPMKWAQARAKQYHASFPDKVFCIGRAGSYDYSVDIDDCIIQAMGMAEKLK